MQIAQNDDTGNNTIEVSNSENGLVVVPGTYDIGDYIGSTNYLITCEETDYSMQVVVFENKETYDNYKNTKWITNGEELAAIEQNALYDCYLDAAQYSLTCTDSYMQAIVFENFDTYKAYHQSSRFTGGEESEAIEKNALLSEYVYEDNSIALNLKEENILLINDGMGSLKMLSK